MPLTINGDPLGALQRWKRGVEVQQGDAIYALQRQRTRILQRTQRGVDYEGRGFAPYSTKGPYYYSPNARNGSASFTDRQNRAAASRLKRKLEKVPTKGAGGIRLSRTGRSLVFDSYAAFKRWLGRVTVDLRGPRAPHMLQALAVRVGSYSALSDGSATGTQPVREGRIGIYGAEAGRADGHNRGSRNLPRRKFLGASQDDRRSIVEDIKQRIIGRLTKK